MELHSVARLPDLVGDDQARPLQEHLPLGPHPAASVRSGQMGFFDDRQHGIDRSDTRPRPASRPARDRGRFPLRVDVVSRSREASQRLSPFEVSVEPSSSGADRRARDRVHREARLHFVGELVPGPTSCALTEDGVGTPTNAERLLRGR